MKTWLMVAIAVGLVIVLLILPGESFAAQPYAQRALCQNPQYTCITVPQGETWQSMFPDETDRTLVAKINRINIPLRPGMVLALPANIHDMDRSYMDFAPFPATVPTPGKKTIVVDPALNAWGAYDVEGNLINWGPAALGKDWCPDINSSCRTVTGTFSVYNKGGPDCKSSKFPIPDGGGPMPNCMFFKGGYALHASVDVPGVNASHGCVRMFYKDAEWLNQNFVEIGTRVIVRPYTSPA